MHRGNLVSARVCLLLGALAGIANVQGKEAPRALPARVDPSDVSDMPRPVECRRLECGALAVDVTGGLVSVDARNVPIRAVVDAIAAEVGISTAYGDALEQRITGKFERLPLNRALSRLLRDRSFILVLKSPAVAGPADQQGRGWIWIFGDAEAVVVEQSDKGRAGAGPLEAATPSGTGATPAEVVRNYIAMQPEDAALMFASAFADGDARARMEALYAVGELGAPAAESLLEQGLADRDPGVREAAVQELAAMGSDEAVAALAVALGDSEVSIRLEAVHALEEIRSPESVALVRRALSDPDASVRETAAEVFETLRTLR